MTESRAQYHAVIIEKGRIVGVDAASKWETAYFCCQQGNLSAFFTIFAFYKIKWRQRLMFY